MSHVICCIQIPLSTKENLKNLHICICYKINTAKKKSGKLKRKYPHRWLEIEQKQEEKGPNIHTDTIPYTFPFFPTVLHFYSFIVKQILHRL